MVRYSMDCFISGYDQEPGGIYTVKLQTVQGLPFGFDLMYLALADRNMQVRFGLKDVLESRVVGI